LFKYGRIYPLRAHGKTPWLRNVKYLKPTSLKTVHHWLTTKPGCNWGLRIDHLSLVVLDLENPAKGDGLATVENLAAVDGPLPGGPVVTTASGGRHLWFMLPPDFDVSRVKNWTRVLPGIDIRVMSGTVVVPPSDISEGSYIWTTPLSEGEDPPVIPDWLLDPILAARPKPPHRKDCGHTAVPVSEQFPDQEESPAKDAEREKKDGRVNTPNLRKTSSPALLPKVKTFPPPLQRKFHRMRRVNAFAATWAMQRADFTKLGGKPDKSKYEMFFACRGAACGCTREEIIEVLHHWYRTHKLDLSRLTASRMKCTIDKAFETTALYRAGWKATHQAKPKLRGAVLAFAAASPVITAKAFLHANPLFRHGAVWQMFSILAQERRLRRLERGCYTAAQLPGDNTP
jgi:hypothetical protein